MRVLILAAGYGTRLYPLTLNKPKPLLPVNNKPIIDFILEKIDNLKDKFSIEEVRVVTNNKFYKDFLHWKKKSRAKVKVINDGSDTPKERRGAVRDIKLAIGNKGGDWLVLGGDNLFEDDLVKFIIFSLAHTPHPSVGLYDVGRKEIASRFGVVKVNSRRRVVELKEKPKMPSSTLAATCIYFFPAQSLKFLDVFLRKGENLDASGKYIEWLAKKFGVYGYIMEGSWFDIGHRDSLRRVEKSLFC